MLNVRLSYKYTSYWRILFWSGAHPRHFSRLKKFRALVVPIGGCRKGIIIQERNINRRFYVAGKSCFRRKEMQQEPIYMHPCRGISLM